MGGYLAYFGYKGRTVQIVVFFTILVQIWTSFFMILIQIWVSNSQKTGLILGLGIDFYDFLYLHLGICFQYFGINMGVNSQKFDVNMDVHFDS